MAINFEAWLNSELIDSCLHSLCVHKRHWAGWLANYYINWADKYLYTCMLEIANWPADNTSTRQLYFLSQIFEIQTHSVRVDCSFDFSAALKMPKCTKVDRFYLALNASKCIHCDLKMKCEITHNHHRCYIFTQQKCKLATILEKKKKMRRKTLHMYT